MSSSQRKLYALDAVYSRERLLVGLVVRHARPDERRTPYSAEHELHTIPVRYMASLSGLRDYANQWRELMHERGRW